MMWGDSYDDRWPMMYGATDAIFWAMVFPALLALVAATVAIIVALRRPPCTPPPNTPGTDVVPADNRTDVLWTSDSPWVRWIRRSTGVDATSSRKGDRWACPR
jgi:hypothetical protein